MAKVLIAEDEVVAQKLFKRYLTACGHEVVAVSNGFDALGQFQVKDFDVVVTDIYMPDLSGHELIPQLRKTKEEVLIIAISSGGPTREKKHALDIAQSLGANTILSKPFELKALSDAINELTGETPEPPKKQSAE